jgi:TolA-binding protein
MKKMILLMTVSAVCACAFAANDAREAFLRQQAFQEMQRVTGQIDVLQANFEELSRKVNSLERKDDSALRAEVDSLRAQVEELRRELRSQRGEIVKDLSARIGTIQRESGRSSAPKKPAYSGPCQEYVVASGDTLTLISQAFNVPISKIKEMNSLKNDNLRIGQKLYLPK